MSSVKWCNICKMWYSLNLEKNRSVEVTWYLWLTSRPTVPFSIYSDRSTCLTFSCGGITCVLMNIIIRYICCKLSDLLWWTCEKDYNNAFHETFAIICQNNGTFSDDRKQRQTFKKVCLIEKRGNPDEMCVWETYFLVWICVQNFNSHRRI